MSGRFFSALISSMSEQQAVHASHSGDNDDSGDSRNSRDMSSRRLDVPGPTPEVEAQRRRELRMHKTWVTGLLVVAAIIFLACSWWIEHDAYVAPAWVGYVRAAAEAGMVGGLADWFAVTALFRYPMGIPIPHTALVPKKKDQIGDALSEFVGENFLNAQLITEKVAEANLPEKAGSWLAQLDNAEKASEQVGRFIANAVAAIDPKDAEALIQHQFIERLSEPAWGPPLGRTLDGLIQDGKVEPIIEEIISWARGKVRTMEDSVIAMIDERMPTWAPKFATNLVGEKVYRELADFMWEIDTNPDHEARRALRRMLTQFASDLQFDSEMITRVERIKADIVASSAVRSAPSEIWASASQSLIDASCDPTSPLRRRITELAQEWGARINTDPQLRADLDRRIEGASRFVADNYAGDITAIISDTIERWDAREAADKIELMVGKDLQYIRVNGTIVGALAGLVIYTVSQVIF